MDEQELMCTSHIRPVTLADGDVWIRHKDGGYCDSEQFAIETLTRSQVMALLLVARGERLMARTVTPRSG
jgi:hypothetical protein